MHLQIRNRVMAAITAFRKPNLITDLLAPEDFDEWESRINRYQILWAFYENTAYDDIHVWARQFKLRFGLYRDTRGIFNPANRLGNFHQTHIWGGLLDMEAGDGKEEPSALPIITDNDDIRPAIANIWKWSNWQIKKDLLTLRGATMGDGFIRVVDNVEKQRVYFELIHPTVVKDLVKDDFGNIKGYVLEEERIDPRNVSRKVTYNEIAKRGDNGEVIFQTLLNGSPYPWNGVNAEWQVDYGFIPFIHTMHIDMGFKYAWAEMHAGRVKFADIDDLASKTTDHIRKEEEGLWLLSGVKKPSSDLKSSTSPSSRDRPQPGREDKHYLYAPNENAKATSLISDIDIGAVSDYIQSMIKQSDKDYPELQQDENEENTAESGVARRIRQQPAAAKIRTRRTVYDDALVRAQQMALSIGAMGEYPGFEKLNPNGFEQDEFAHSIGKRDVFESDKFEDLQESKLFWETAAVATSAGITLESYLTTQGWSDAEIRDIIRQNVRRATQDARAAARDLQQEEDEQGSPVEIVDTTPPDGPEAGQ